MSAVRRYAVTAALAGLTILAACGPAPASQPGAARSPGPAISTQAPPATTPAPATVTPAPSGTPKAPRQPVLRPDPRGSAVLTRQQRLAALHYFDVARADGVYGPGTYHAVVAFQKVQGLTRDGIAGPATRARLAHDLHGPQCR
jgi:peptidoglycan hydrolase-like protein with peptidoglycan-binding domain